MDYESFELKLAKEELLDTEKELVQANASLDAQLNAFSCVDGSSIRKAQLMQLVQVYIAPLSWVTRAEKATVTESLSFKKANYQLQNATKSLMNAYERRARAEYSKKNLLKRIKFLEIQEEGE